MKPEPLAPGFAPGVIPPLVAAWEHMIRLLFRPFDPSRWLAVGFTAWLASLGRMGGSFGGGSQGSRNKGGTSFDLGEMWRGARDWMQDNWAWLVPVVIAALVVGLALYLVLLWLGSRGEFQFYHNVSTGRAEVAAPWHAYRRHGNSLFLFRLGLSLTGLLVVLPLLAAGGWAGVVLFDGREDRAVPLALFSISILLLLVVSLVWAVISKLTRDFVVPVMALRTSSCRTAWGAVGRLMASDPSNFLVYLLFQVVLWIGVGIALIGVILLTCCVAACFLAIPYVGTVLLLPVLVLFRSYTLHFLAQYGPEWNVFAASSPGGVP
ncbi:MAG: hypothetical protein JNL10_18210 [Verrucomicrobiales bacterium]|nr:hypothetical protein [Verrucomicrobiales bacterium]